MTDRTPPSAPSAAADDGPRDPPETWTVGALTAAIGDRVRQAFPTEVWVRGEIHDLSRARSGHVYFTLRGTDDDGSASQLSVILTASAKIRVNRLLTRAGGRVRMTDGTEVRIRGRVDFFEPRGQLQLRMTSIDPAFTLGQLAAARAALLDALRADGSLRANAARAVPIAPLRIGLVTAAGSAAEADVIDGLVGSGFRFQILSADVRVQGPDAPGDVAAALAGLGGRDIDLVILVRGGGAASDLSAFDSELVARAIAACPVAVVTGIGHETDRSVADEVAHTAAKTPTAAARAVVDLVADALERAERAWQAIAVRGLHRIEVHDQHLTRSTARARAAASSAAERADDRLDAARDRLSRSARAATTSADAALSVAAARLGRAAHNRIEAATRTLDTAAARARALDPARALERGWTITRLADGTAVRSVDDVDIGATLHTTLADGTLVSVVTTPPPEEH